MPTTHSTRLSDIVGVCMEHQAFSKYGLAKAIRKSDFLDISKDKQESYRESLLNEAELAAASKFSSSSNLLSSFNLNGNLVFKLNNHSDQLVERKLTINLRRSCGVRAENRSNIIKNLQLFLREGVPYRVYRLDIRKFYESFHKANIEEKVDEVIRLSPLSKLLIRSLLNKHQQLGGRGLPRGLPISSVLAELMMEDFDLRLKNNDNIFFYSRYVDDIIIITSGNEAPEELVSFISQNLPEGLVLNAEKQEVSDLIKKLKPPKSESAKEAVACFEYLGYKFTVSNPSKINDQPSPAYRHIDIDLAEKKSNRYKLRMSRSFYDFKRTNDWFLLKDRIKYLSSNFKVFNPHIEKTKLAGIYHNYPAIQFESKNLDGLDYYLRSLVLKGNSRLARLVHPSLTSPMKRELLSNSFRKGHDEKKFVHFTARRIKEIKKCWER